MLIWRYQPNTNLVEPIKRSFGFSLVRLVIFTKSRATFLFITPLKKLCRYLGVIHRYAFFDFITFKRYDVANAV